MSKKYKFNPENFTYQKDDKKGRIMRIVLTQLVLIVILSVIIYTALSYSFDSEIEIEQKNKNEELKKEYKYMLKLYAENEKYLKQLEKQDKDLFKIIFGTALTQDSSVNYDFKFKNAKKEVTKNTEKIDKLYEHLRQTEQKYTEFLEELKNKTDKFENIPSIQPLPNNHLQVYGYGLRLDPIYHTPSFHKGIDYNAPIGTPVFATANGKIIKAGRGSRIEGNIVEIKHGDFVTRYLHLGDIATSAGKKIVRGQKIAYVGTSGKSIIPHLHYEVIYKGTHVNPIFFFFLELSPREFNEIYKKSTTAGISLD